MRRSPIVIASLLLFCQNFTLACECGPPAAACAYVNDSSVVFAGKVVYTNDDQSGKFTQQTLVRFEVEEAFKGLPSGTHDVWIDPGSFTSCYAEYNVGERWLIFAYNGFRMPADTAAVSVVPGKNAKPLPPGIDPHNPPTVYSAPECSGSRLITTETQASIDPDIQHLRRLKAGTATPEVTGRVNLWEFDSPQYDEGLPGVKVTLSGNGPALSALTDSDGRYLFNPVLIGKYSVRASLPSYLPSLRQQTVTASATGCGYADFEMVGTGVIQGLVVDHAGRPLTSVQVDIGRLGNDGQLDESKSDNTQSDRSGRYRFANLPQGTFEIGVNLFDAPGADTPYKQTLWTQDGNSKIRLNPGQKENLSPLKMPIPAKAHKIDAEVYWPDGSPAQGVTVWGFIGNEPGESGDTDANGVAHLSLLEGFTYNVEAKIWVGPKDNQEVARSGPTEWGAPSGPNHLKLVLTQRSKEYDLGP